MGKPLVGSVVVLLFPFSNLRGAKRRPALVLAKAEFGNCILGQITSKPYSSMSAIKLLQKDFAQGSLPVASYLRPDKLFTAEASLFVEVKGQVATKQIVRMKMS